MPSDGHVITQAGRSDETVSATARGVGVAARDSGGSCVGVVCDHSDDASVEALLACIATGGKVMCAVPPSVAGICFL
jgi:hypothetical protein